MRLLAAMALSLAGCDTNSSHVCEGTFRLSGISSQALQRDARAMIMQFAGADQDVDVELGRSTADRVVISGVGEACARFGRSFLQSQMREFQGLQYQGT